MSTLLEDWKERRDRLLALPEPQRTDSYYVNSLRVLEFLIDRYSNSEIAAREARFPMLSDLMLDRRTIIVHHHLRRSAGGSTKTEADATGRASKILARMSSLNLQASVKAPAGGALVGDPFDPEPRRAAESRRMSNEMLSAWLAIQDAVSRQAKWQAYLYVERAYECGRELPDVALNFLSGRVEAGQWDSLTGAKMLVACTNASALYYVFEAWRYCVSREQSTLAIPMLEEFFLQPNRREPAAEKLRTALAEEEPMTRIHALRLLAQLGTLDDIGLLLDLLPLSVNDVDAREKAQILKSIDMLTGLP